MTLQANNIKVICDSPDLQVGPIAIRNVRYKGSCGGWIPVPELQFQLFNTSSDEIESIDIDLTLYDSEQKEVNPDSSNVYWLHFLKPKNKRSLSFLLCELDDAIVCGELVVTKDTLLSGILED